MTQEHPTTPPPQLVLHWINSEEAQMYEDWVAIQAARWGADQELEACCEWLSIINGWKVVAESLRSWRRPKPPSLKEQALAQVESFACSMETLGMDSDLIRRALESLPD